MFLSRNPTPILQDKIVSTKWIPFKENKEILEIDEDLKMLPEEYTIYYKTWDKIYNCLYEFECKFLENSP